MKVDVKDLDADFLVFSGHKMLAPLELVFYMERKNVLNDMKPFLFGET